MGRAWRKTSVRVRLAIVVGTGTTPIVNGALLFIKNIFMKTDANEILANISGRALHEFLIAETATTPSGITAIAAANGNYDVYLDINHIVSKMFNRPNDTILDTGRYKSMSLQITLGTIADLLAVVGTATVTATLDVEAETSAGALPGKAQPHFYRSMFEMAPVVPTVQTFIDLDKARDLAIIKALLLTSKTATAGVAFTGVGDNVVINDFDVRDQDKFYQQFRLFGFSQQDDKSTYGYEVQRPGVTFIDFAKDDSLYSALYTGNKAQLRLQWRNGVAVGTDQVSVAYDALRALVK